MTKLIDSILSKRLSPELIDIIYEYARDDSKKKEFLVLYRKLHYIWNAFTSYSCPKKRKFIKVFPKSSPTSSLWVRFGRFDKGDDEYIEYDNIKISFFMHIDTKISYDDNFIVTCIVPTNFIFDI
jgi:hypothetical protein